MKFQLKTAWKQDVEVIPDFDGHDVVLKFSGPFPAPWRWINRDESGVLFTTDEALEIADALYQLAQTLDLNRQFLPDDDEI